MLCIHPACTCSMQEPQNRKFRQRLGAHSKGSEASTLQRRTGFRFCYESATSHWAAAGSVLHRQRPSRAHSPPVRLWCGRQKSTRSLRAGCSRPLLTARKACCTQLSTASHCLRRQTDGEEVLSAGQTVAHCWRVCDRVPLLTWNPASNQPGSRTPHSGGCAQTVDSWAAWVAKGPVLQLARTWVACAEAPGRVPPSSLSSILASYRHCRNF